MYLSIFSHHLFQGSGPKDVPARLGTRRTSKLHESARRGRSRDVQGTPLHRNTAQIDLEGSQGLERPFLTCFFSRVHALFSGTCIFPEKKNSRRVCFWAGNPISRKWPHRASGGSGDFSCVPRSLWWGPWGPKDPKDPKTPLEPMGPLGPLGAHGGPWGPIGPLLR